MTIPVNLSQETKNAKTYWVCLIAKWIGTSSAFLKKEELEKSNNVSSKNQYTTFWKDPLCYLIVGMNMVHAWEKLSFAESAQKDEKTVTQGALKTESIERTWKKTKLFFQNQ